jgi:hypothetical protein
MGATGCGECRFYLPQSLAPFTAIFATLAEAVLGVWLLLPNKEVLFIL